jgi:hypothetical protein
MRILSSTAPSGSIGELQSGATTHVTVTLSALPGSSFVTAVLHVGAAQLDPDPSNNSVLVQAAVLPGHPGPPGLTAGTGAFAPPLFARRVGKTWSVAARVHLDEVATITVQVRDTSGRVVPMLPGTTVDYLPALRPHTQIPHAVTGAGWVPLRLRVGGPVGRRYAIVVRAVGPDGSASRTTIAFRT